MKRKMIEGIFQGNRNGYGFVISDDSNVDIFIPRRRRNNAVDGDTVIVRYRKRKRGFEGEIARIVKRRNPVLVGVYRESSTISCVVPDNEKIEVINIPKNRTNKAKDNNKVVVRIDSWPRRRKRAYGSIIEVLGHCADSNVLMKSIIIEKNFSEKFPQKVVINADKVPSVITKKLIDGRVDLRGEEIYTIDGEDAKDFDDAISIRKSQSGYILGVHIADVSHYVDNSAMDREAFDRATSVYLVGKVLPMLPERLSNHICSLKEKEDRLTVSVIMKFTNDGYLKDYNISESIIKVNKRLTYGVVDKILKDNNSPFHKKCVLMKELSDILYKQRIKEGGLNFDIPDSIVLLNDDGSTKAIIKINKTASRGIIEEFMIYTNQVVAKYLSDRPMIYRVHEPPDTASIREFKMIAQEVGVKVKSNKYTQKNFQDIILASKNKSYEYLINIMLLRTLKLAMYSSVNKGHFGLAKDYYTHFTSPIRRYPDLIVHKILKEKLHNIDKSDKWIKRLSYIASHCSKKERDAQSAEEESKKLKKIEYLKNKIGNIYSGIVSGFSNNGMFVELTDFVVDGMVLTKSANNVYKLGDNVNVMIINANLQKRRIDLKIV